jgi:hypothetical protein
VGRRKGAFARPTAGPKMRHAIRSLPVIAGCVALLSWVLIVIYLRRITAFFVGYSNADERVALVIGATSFVLNAFFAFSMTVLTESRPSMRVRLVAIGFGTSIMCFMFLVASVAP